MAKQISWELYRSFLAVMRQGSLSAAARFLGATQPTIGRHIGALEEALGQTLFMRTREGLLPTDTARALLKQASEMASIAASLERTATHQNGNIGGTIRVTASEVIGVEVLPSILGPLRIDNPELQLEMVLSNQPQDLLHREADIAIRMYRPEQVQLIARRVGQVELGLYGTPHYLALHGLPTQPTDLANHAVVGFDEPTQFIRQAIKKAPPEYRRNHFAFATDNDLAQLALIRASAGLGVCQVPLAQREPPLVRVLPKYFSLVIEIWITMHEDLRSNPSCRALFELLGKGLKEYTDSVSPTIDNNF